MSWPVRAAAWIGAKQKFPTWLGPPRSSSRMFQSVQPSVPELKSLIIDRPYASPRLHRPYPVESNVAGVPSVKRMCLSGYSRFTQTHPLYRGHTGKEDVFVGIQPVHQRHVAVHLLPTRPVFIPVEADPPGVFRGRRILEDRQRPLDDEVAVMVPHDDVDFPQEPLLRHHRTQVILEIVRPVRPLIHARF